MASTSGADGLLLMTPWDGLASVAAHHYPWLPAGLLLRDRYDSVGNLGGFRGRIAVVVAEHDSIVPPKLGHRLYESIAAEKRLWVVAGADHNDWIARVVAGWWASVAGFLLAER